MGDLLILSIIAAFGIALVISFYNEIMDVITDVIDRIRLFLFENKSLVDGLFMIVYAIIQWIFILRISKASPTEMGITITAFILILLTVMGIERLCLKSRFNYLANLMEDTRADYYELQVEYAEALGREKHLISLLRKQKTGK